MAKVIYGNNSLSIPKGTDVIPWGSSPELMGILQNAATIWGGGTENITPDAFRLNDQAQYSQGWQDYFAKNPTVLAAVNPAHPQMMLPGTDTAQYLKHGQLNESNIQHEIPHLVSKYFNRSELESLLKVTLKALIIESLSGLYICFIKTPKDYLNYNNYLYILNYILN